MKALLTSVLLLYAIISAHAQSRFDDVVIKTHTINDKISFLEGSGGNIGVLHGEDGIMIIDDQFAELSDKIKAAISDLSNGQLKFIVNSHYHGDHTGGNANMSADGGMIVAHQNVRERLGMSYTGEFSGREMTAKPESYWPVITFSESINFYLNEEAVEITFVANAHTDGDALIYFKNSNVMHTGDLFVRYGYPYIDVDAGGTIGGMIAAQEKILELTNEQTKIIPGHGGVASQTEVKELLEMLKSTRDIIAKLKAEGKSMDESMSAKPFENFHDRWSGSFINSDLFVRTIYTTLP